MLKFNQACSLGPFCHSAQLLKRNHYKTCSYPFDWIFSNCDTILDCLHNDFKVFLDKSYYIPVSDQRCGHSKYNERMFNHHNPIYPNDYNYYTRCVSRFRSFIKTTQHKLFIMMFVNGTKIKTKQIIQFNDTFSKYTTNYTLLIINHKQGKRKHKFVYKDNIHFLKLQTETESNGLTLDEDDNLYLDAIIQLKYRYEIKIF